ncbi:hypothetical protein ACWD4G_27960 [Streptomyces sp. NPDC002643]
MRLFRSFAPVALAAALLACFPYEAIPHARVGHGHTRVGGGNVYARVTADRPDPFGASCYSRVFGSQVIGYCFNRYAELDHVRMHIECERWWDLDSDGAPVEAGPAQTVRLTGRCWKEVREVWFSHHRLAD